jgi:WD40 repeat protein
MPDAADLDALVSQWQRAREDGHDPTAEELCAELPELAPELQRRIDVLRRLEGWGKQRLSVGGTVHDAAQGPATLSHPPSSTTLPTLTQGPPGYEILGLLGRGGMGVVYRARQTALNRVVALKMILGGSHAGDEERLRFLAEAEVVASLRHPGIVQVHDFGTHDGIPWFALEYCPGGSLEERLGGKPLPPASAAHVTRLLADAVQHAHEAGIIHRDLKPANILLRPGPPTPGLTARPEALDSNATPWPSTPGGLDPLITDFGLARRIEAAAGITRPGAVMGTPSYMSPEQGRGGQVGPETDQYALGAMLYEMLTGRPPFQGATPQETLTQAAILEPVPPRALNPTVPPDLETIVLKCLEKDPRRRYASCRELAADLARWERGEPILARPISSWGRLVRWCRRSPAIAALAAVIVAVTAAALVAITILWRQAAAARDRAIAQEKLTQQQRDAALEAHNRAEALLYATQLALAQREIERGHLAQALRHLDSCRWDLRGWEHRLLYTRILQGQVRLEGHRSPVTALAATSRLILTGTASGQAFLWNASSGAVHHPLACPGPVTAAALTPALAIAGTEEGLLVVWDAQSGKKLASLAAHDGPVAGLALLPGPRLVSAGRDQTVQVRELPSLRSLGELEGADENLTCLTVSPGGHLVAAGGQEGMAHVWDAEASKVRFTVNAGPGRVGCAAFSPDGRLLATGGSDRVIRLWDARTGEALGTLQGPRRAVAHVDFSPDSALLAAACADDQLYLWEMPSRKALPPIEAVAGGVAAAAWCPRGRILWCGGQDGSLRAIDPWRRSAPGPRHLGEVSAVAWSPQGELVSAGWDSVVRLGGLALRGHDGEVAAVAFAGGKLYTGGADGTIREWGPDGHPGRILAAHEGGVNGLVAVPGGQLASCSADGTVRLWDLASGQDLLKLRADTELAAVACSPDGALLAAAGTSGAVHVWERRGGQPVRHLRAHTAAVNCLAFSPDGAYLASAGADQAVVLWDVKSGGMARVLEGHTLPVTALAWSSDSSRLASGGEDGQLSLWSPAAGLRLLSIPAHRGTVSSLAFGPGDTLASGGYDRMVHLWDARLCQPRLAAQNHYAPLAELRLLRGGCLLGTDRSGNRVAWSAVTGRLTDPPEGGLEEEEGPLEVGLTAQGEPWIQSRAALAANTRCAREALQRLQAGPGWRLGRCAQLLQTGQWRPAWFHACQILP